MPEALVPKKKQSASPAPAAAAGKDVRDTIHAGGKSDRKASPFSGRKPDKREEITALFDAGLERYADSLEVNLTSPRDGLGNEGARRAKGVSCYCCPHVASLFGGASVAESGLTDVRAAPWEGRATRQRGASTGKRALRCAKR